MDLNELAAEFPRDAVHWRVQGQPYERNGQHAAMALAYIDARDVMDRLDAVCGPANWQNDYVETAKGRVICRIGIRVDDGWVWKSDGAGDTAVEGEKGGISDSLKRAAVQWGIGRYLYRLDSPWVACNVREKNGKKFWKSWAEDPWNKVKQTSYNAAAQAQKPPEPPADENPKPKADAPSWPDVRDRMKSEIQARNSASSKLATLLNGEAFQSRLFEMATADRPKYLEVVKAAHDAWVNANGGGFPPHLLFDRIEGEKEAA